MEDEASNSKADVSRRARRQRGWWKSGVLETKSNTVDMTAWVHKECDIMDEDALLRFQGAWENPERKDECVVRMNDFERDYWMGTEVGQLGGYGFQGAFFDVDGPCKDGKMVSGCCKFQGGRGRQMCTSRQRRRGHEFEQAGFGGSCVSVTVSLTVSQPDGGP